MSHVAEEWQFGSRHVFQAFMARPADRNQIVKSVGRHCRREQPDRYLVMDVELPSQRLLRNLAIAATEAVTFSRQRGLHLPVPTPELRAAPQEQALPVVRKYGCPRLAAGTAAEVEPHLSTHNPPGDFQQDSAPFASDRDRQRFRYLHSIGKTQLQLVQAKGNATSHVYRPGHNP